MHYPNSKYDPYSNPYPNPNTNSNPNPNSDSIYIYLAADNEQVKDVFATILVNQEDNPNNLTINVMRVETKFIQHAKNVANFKKATNNEGKG
jgi:hypothetical protein